MIADDDSFLRTIADGRYDDAIMLVEAGVSLNEPLDDGASPLFAAVLSGHLPLLETMLRRGADPSFGAQEPAMRPMRTHYWTSRCRHGFLWTGAHSSPSRSSCGGTERSTLMATTASSRALLR
jgi:ankyrin repeat protein